MGGQALKLLDRDKLENAYITYSTIFDMALANTPAIYTEITTVIPDAGPVNQFNWLGDMPVMTDWVGPRTINRLRAEKHTLTTSWFANGIELDIDDVAEDKLGLVRPRIEMLAEMGPRKIDAVSVDFYNNGFTGALGLCYDGQFLFDSDHTADGAGVGVAQSNVQSGAFSSTTFNQGITKMMGFKGTNGEPLNIVPDTLLAGPSQQLAVRQLLQAQYNAAGATNIDYQYTRGIINARITGAFNLNWFLLALKYRVRAVLVGIEVPPSFAELMGWDQLHVFMHRTMLAGAHMKVGWAYGLWQTAVGGVGS
jgi:phage major head subunit gpT-like protein